MGKIKNHSTEILKLTAVLTGWKREFLSGIFFFNLP
jgi:hypothetical protein